MKRFLPALSSQTPNKERTDQMMTKTTPETTLRRLNRPAHWVASRTAAVATILSTLILIVALNVATTLQGTMTHPAQTVLHDGIWSDPYHHLKRDYKHDCLLEGWAKKRAIRRQEARLGWGDWSVDGYYVWSIAEGGVTVDIGVLDPGDTVNISSWVQATADQGNPDVPDKSSVSTNRLLTDPEGRNYKYDEERVTERVWYSFEADAITSYKEHFAAVHHKQPLNPLSEIIERGFYHSNSASGWKWEPKSCNAPLPELNPWAHASITNTARMSVGMTADEKKYATSKCTGSSAHAPGPCPP